MGSIYSQRTQHASFAFSSFSDFTHLHLPRSVLSCANVLHCTLYFQCFAVRSLGWVEMSEEDMAPGKSSVAVNNCIRQLSYHKHNLHDTAGIWGEVRGFS